ncbi:MAG TPA: zinc ribbon domain-containing protein [Acidimicrobiales bacterium]|nr:zinc ribbon domain-containing protein [Acidimicrobiales bacterium]
MNGHEVLAGDRFCGQCGWAVPAHCPYGHPAQPDHAFCKECGAAVRQAAPSADQTLVPSTWMPPPGPGPGGTAPVPSTTRPTGRSHWSTGARTAAVVAAVLVLAAAGLGIAAGMTGGRGQAASSSPMPGVGVPAAARSAVVPSFGGPHRSRPIPVPQTTEPPSSNTPSIDTPSTDTTQPPASPTGSAVAGLAPLVGDWTGHGGGVHIGADGQGQATFRAYRFCSDDPTPPCDTMNGGRVVPGGHAQFRLTAASAPGSARGQVTSSDDPGAFQPGFAMTISLSSGDVMLVSSSPTAQSVAYCGSQASTGTCGA